MKMFNTIDELLTEDVKTIAISGHIRPDGDCVGSCMSLYGYICKNHQDKTVNVYLEDFSDSYKFLKHTENIKHSIEGESHVDLFIALDLGDIERLGFAAPLFMSAKKKACIDHHISNKGFGDIYVIDPTASATCEVLYTLMDSDKLDTDIAEALYTGIIHDCGVFQYTNTTPETMKIASELIAYGFPFTKIIEESFYQKTYVQNQLLGKALMESNLICKGKVIYSAVMRKDLELYGATPKDLDAIVANLRQTKGVEVAIFLYETDDDNFKISMRSNNDVDVSRIAVAYHGGGHKKAAGCSMRGTVREIIEILSGQIDSQLQEMKRS